MSGKTIQNNVTDARACAYRVRHDLARFFIDDEDGGPPVEPHFSVQYSTLCVLLVIKPMVRMGYIPQPALENLRKYSYKGVDKQVPRSFDLYEL